MQDIHQALSQKCNLIQNSKFAQIQSNFLLSNCMYELEISTFETSYGLKNLEIEFKSK